MSGTTRTRSGAESDPSPLFADSYWYERLWTPTDETVVRASLVLPRTKTHDVSVDELAAEIERILGTRILSAWAPAEATRAVLVYFDLDTENTFELVADNTVSDVRSFSARALETSRTTSEGADLSALPGFIGREAEPPTIAAELKQVSGLTIDELAALFPAGRGQRGRMSRENYHRWMRRSSEPDSGNLQRLLALRACLKAAAERVTDLHVWLLSPIEDDRTPYDLLRAGALTHVWELMGALPSAAPRRAVQDAEGGRGVRIESSLRSGEQETPFDEADDASDWIGD
jgi:hypothetical protein